jgi:hypothetical protein
MFQVACAEGGYLAGTRFALSFKEAKEKSDKTVRRTSNRGLSVINETVYLVMKRASLTPEVILMVYEKYYYALVPTPPRYGETWYNCLRAFLAEKQARIQSWKEQATRYTADFVPDSARVVGTGAGAKRAGELLRDWTAINDTSTNILK